MTPSVPYCTANYGDSVRGSLAVTGFQNARLRSAARVSRTGTASAGAADTAPDRDRGNTGAAARIAAGHIAAARIGAGCTAGRNTACRTPVAAAADHTAVGRSTADRIAAAGHTAAVDIAAGRIAAHPG